MKKGKFHLYEKKWMCVLIMVCKAIVSAFQSYYLAKMFAVLVDGTTTQGIAVTVRTHMGEIFLLLTAIVN